MSDIYSYIVFYNRILKHTEYYVSLIRGFLLKEYLLHNMELSYKTRYPVGIAEDLFRIRYEHIKIWDTASVIRDMWDNLTNIKSSLREDINLDIIFRGTKELEVYEYKVLEYRLKEVLYPGYDKDLLEYMYGIR